MSILTTPTTSRRHPPPRRAGLSHLHAGVVRGEWIKLLLLCLT